MRSLKEQCVIQTHVVVCVCGCVHPSVIVYLFACFGAKLTLLDIKLSKIEQPFSRCV